MVVGMLDARDDDHLFPLYVLDSLDCTTNMGGPDIHHVRQSVCSSKRFVQATAKAELALDNTGSLTTATSQGAGSSTIVA